jgi:uncharacterized protein
MTTQRMFGATTEEKAYIAPFLAFLGLILLGAIVGKPFEGRQVFWALGEPQYWVNPAQTLLCGGLLVVWWRHYPWAARRGAGLGTGLGIGILVLLLWIAPQEFFGLPKRYEGFNPYFFGTSGPGYAVTLGLRLLRLVVVVPLMEEIFWRGFLLRYCIHGNFSEVPFGTFTWSSFWIVTGGFCLEHQPVDWPAAALAGVLYNLVAYRTRSLGACVLAHAATNLLLGAYVLRTGQWGFW